MGTNFYINNLPEEWDWMDPEYHIGKRSAAGLYCWDCRVSLFSGPIERLHFADPEYHMRNRCPECDKEPIKEGLTAGSAAVELGFAQPYKLEERFGVKSCCSFTWAMLPSIMIFEANNLNKPHWKFWEKCKPIMDEYERQYTVQEFIEKVLWNSPIQYFNMIGGWFA
jgi:hypothetical protein